MTGKQPVDSEESNKSNVYLIRGRKVMLGMHLAEVYEVEQKVLVQAVEHNIGCFPENSVFQLNREEIDGLESQHAISSETLPYAFTAQGVAMLSSILFDERTNNNTCTPTCSCRK